MGGTSDVAIMAYLERNPTIKQVSLCLDNDPAGKQAAETISKSLSEKYKDIEIVTNLPIQHKDYNEALQSLILQAKNQQGSPKREAVSSIEV